MSRQWIAWDSPEHARKHHQTLIAKQQKIATLQALLEMWEAHPTHDHAYVIHLRAKLRSAKNQLDAMLP